MPKLSAAVLQLWQCRSTSCWVYAHHCMAYYGCVGKFIPTLTEHRLEYYLHVYIDLHVVYMSAMHGKIRLLTINVT